MSLSIGQLFMRIGANNVKIEARWVILNDFEQFLNQLQFDLISLLVNFVCELE